MGYARRTGYRARRAVRRDTWAARHPGRAVRWDAPWAARHPGRALRRDLRRLLGLRGRWWRW